MGTQSRRVDVGTERGRDLVRQLGREIRDARRQHGLAQGTVGRAVGVTGPSVSRIERGLFNRVSVEQLARIMAVVGLELSARAYPAGEPLRDAAHAALLADFSARIHRSLRVTLEVPLPIPGDQRAWDALVRGSDFRVAVEAETVPRDAQALIRRISLKARDSDIDSVILLVRDTERTRRFLRESGPLLAAQFPMPGRRALELLAAGAAPGGGAVVMLPKRRP